MAIQKDQIEFIFMILRENNIFSIEDIMRLKRHNQTLIYSKDYPWVGTICQIVDGFYSDTERYIEKTSGQIFMVDQMSNENYDNLLKYSCIFPNRMILSSGQLLYLNDPNQAFIDVEFFQKLFWSKSLLDKDLIRISPFSRHTEIKPGLGDPSNCLIEFLSFADDEKKKIAELDSCGTYGIGTPVKKNCIYLMMPWLQNADISTYLEIIERNKNEFEAYNLNLQRIAENTDDIEAFLKEFDGDLKEANINIACEMEKKQRELKNRGIITALSVAITAIPFFIPEMDLINPEVYSKIMGGINGIQIIENLKEICHMGNVGRDNPFWVLWKWQNKSE